MFSLVTAQAMANPVVAVEAAEMMSFGAFKTAFNKSYDAEEEAKRAAIYADNVAYFAEHNAKYAKGESTFYMGVNEYSDLTHDEFKAMLDGPKIEPRVAENIEVLPKTVSVSGAA